MRDPLARPSLQLRALLQALRDHDVDWVLSGSTVLAIYGAQVIPNDLDVVPAPDPENLRRVARLLKDLDAIPAHIPEWPGGLNLEQCHAWRPEPPTSRQLDHLFVTRLGMVDVPPSLTGTYAQLRSGAAQLELAGTQIWVCDPDEVLKRIPERPRPKGHRAHDHLCHGAGTVAHRPTSTWSGQTGTTSDALNNASVESDSFIVRTFSMRTTGKTVTTGHV